MNESSGTLKSRFDRKVESHYYEVMVWSLIVAVVIFVFCFLVQLLVVINFGSSSFLATIIRLLVTVYMAFWTLVHLVMMGYTILGSRELRRNFWSAFLGFVIIAAILFFSILVF